MSYRDPNIDVRRVGRVHLSLYITLPARFISTLNVQFGDYVTAELVGDELRIKRLHTPHKEIDYEGRKTE